DRVRLADRIVNDAPLAGDLIYRQLHRRRQRSTNEINFVGLDQLERTRRRLTRIEFIVTHDELGLARRVLIKPIDGQLSTTNLIICLGAVGPADREWEANLDRRLLRARNIYLE